jgi:hypothetical protein
MNARPTFLKWSLAVFVVLLPFLAYSIWDLVEAARLRSRVRAIVASGLPIAGAYRPSVGEATSAEQYYRAAAALVSFAQADPSVSTELRNRTFKAIQTDGDWTADVVATARRRVDQNREALSFVDRASALPFAGLTSGAVGPLGQLLQLSQLCELRAMVLAAEGNADGAVDSLHSEVRLARVMDTEVQPWGLLYPAFRTLMPVLQRTKPSPSSLERLSESLAELDRDDRMKQRFIRFRAEMLNQVSTSRPPSLQPGAFVTHLTVRALDVFSELIAASEQPWKTRVAAAIAVGKWPQPNIFALTSSGPKMLVVYVRATAEETKRVRCARLRVDDRLDLVDPFSGHRLEIGSCGQ